MLHSSAKLIKAIKNEKDKYKLTHKTRGLKDQIT